MRGTLACAVTEDAAKDDAVARAVAVSDRLHAAPVPVLIAPPQTQQRKRRAAGGARRR